MKQLIILLTTLMISACGSDGGSVSTEPPLPRQGVEQNPDILSYVEAFEARYNIDVNYTVTFDTSGETGEQGSSGTTVGVCRVWSNGYREVLINKEWWDGQADVSRKILVFHELGHCSFDRGHNTAKDATVSPNRPESIMYPTINPIVYWYSQNQTYRDYYENELVNNRQNAIWSSLYMTDDSDGELIKNEEAPHISPEKNHGDCVQFID